MIKRYETNDRMSQVVVYNGVAYLAGQVGEPGSNIQQQTQQALNEVDRLLHLVGSDKTKILSATIWLKDMKDFNEMNTIWDQWVAVGHTPARATGESKLAGPEYLVEVIINAAVN